MEYDPDDLRQVQQLRALLDPIPIHPRGKHVMPADPPDEDDWDDHGSLSPQEVVTARLEQVVAQDEPAPIEQAPWGEAMLCVWSTFNDARFATSPQWVGVVKYTFQEYLALRDLDPEAMLPDHFLDGPILPADMDPDRQDPTDATVHDLGDVDDLQWMGITETHREEANAFRRRIKYARDRVFLEELYDQLQAVPDITVAVPKLVWRDAALEMGVGDDEDPNAPETADVESAQSGLDMF